MTTISENVKIGQNVKISNPTGPGPERKGMSVWVILAIIIGILLSLYICYTTFKKYKINLPIKINEKT